MPPASQGPRAPGSGRRYTARKAPTTVSTMAKMYTVPCQVRDWRPQPTVL